MTASVLLEETTIKKGLLWQQWDRFFSRWKERFFLLTQDYLVCFKKGSKVGISEMGTFLYKVRLNDVEGLQWADKKRDGVIALRVRDGQLLLWTSRGLDDWMFALREAVTQSKGRREALRKSSTLGPQLCDNGLWRGFEQQCTLPERSGPQPPVVDLNIKGSLESLRSVLDRQSTPRLSRNIQRMSGVSGNNQFMADLDNKKEYNRLPQCGSQTSLSSLTHLQRPQVSPAQRSLYGQHILGSPSKAAVVNEEFLRPASPLAYHRSCSTHVLMPGARPSSIYGQPSLLAVEKGKLTYQPPDVVPPTIPRLAETKRYLRPYTANKSDSLFCLELATTPR